MSKKYSRTKGMVLGTIFFFLPHFGYNEYNDLTNKQFEYESILRRQHVLCQDDIQVQHNVHYTAVLRYVHHDRNLNQADFISWTPVPVYYRFVLPYHFFAQHIYTKNPNKSLNTNLTFQSMFASADFADGPLSLKYFGLFWRKDLKCNSSYYIWRRQNHLTLATGPSLVSEIKFTDGEKD